MVEPIRITESVDVTITAEDIAVGIRGDMWRCPLGRAMARTRVALQSGEWCVSMSESPAAHRFVCDFDAGVAVVPQTVAVKLVRTMGLTWSPYLRGESK